jgi:hypothetical protein
VLLQLVKDQLLQPAGGLLTHEEKLQLIQESVAAAAGVDLPLVSLEPLAALGDHRREVEAEHLKEAAAAADMAPAVNPMAP